MGKIVGLRTEIIVNIVMLMAAALVFVGMLLLKMTEKELVSQKVGSVVESSEILARSFMAGSRNSGPRILGAEDGERLASILSSAYSLEGWVLCDQDANPLYARDPQDAIKVKPSLVRSARLGGGAVSLVYFPSAYVPLMKREGGYVEVVAPLQHQGVFTGALLMRYSLEEVGERIATGEKLILAYVVIYGALLVIFGVYLLGRVILRPIRKLQQSTCEVAEGNLDQGVATEGPREIAALAGSFNVMLSALRSSREETGRHIASLKKNHEDLQQAQEELVRSAKLASVGHLAAGMAHEVGNPLGALMGYMELLCGTLEKEDERDLVRRSLAEASRIDRLVRDLLDYARPEKSSAEWFDPGSLASEVAAFLENQGAFDQRQLFNRLPESLGPIKAVRHKLFQVFVNLLLNARDATSAGGSIEIGGVQDGNRVTLYVADNGAGMSPEICDHVFDPFFTTKAPDKGRGLGLAVCHRVVEESGGRILVESQQGKGSRFTVSFKVAESAENGH